MPNVLTPSAKQKFFDNNGAPAAGYKVFTYAAGTTTKIATKVSPSGADNANPIILDYRGEADIWLAPNVSYKYVFAPSTDTDPPTHAIWTVDNVVSSQLITLYGGTDTGSANAYVVTFTANFTSLTDGVILYWLATNANTGASTLNVNGLGAVPVLNSDGSALTQAAIAANTIVGVIYRGGNWYLLYPSVTGGTFTGTITGVVGTVTGTVSYKIVNRLVTLYVTPDITGTSNATAFTMTGLASVVLPVGLLNRRVPCMLQDNGTQISGFAIVNNAGSSITFTAAKVSGAFVVSDPAGFTAAGTKGLTAGWTITYPQ